MILTWDPIWSEKVTRRSEKYDPKMCSHMVGKNGCVRGSDKFEQELYLRGERMHGGGRGGVCGSRGNACLYLIRIYIQLPPLPPLSLISRHFLPPPTGTPSF